MSALKFLEKHDMTQANITSVSIAKMAAMVASALGGKKISVTPEDFLPFDTRKIKKESGITEESARVLKKLLKSRKIDARLLAALAEEIKASSMRDEE